MLLSPWRRSRRPPDDVSRGDGPQWPSTPCRVDRRMGADRAPVRLARAEGLRAHPPDGAVRWPDLRARGGGGGRAASERTLQRRVLRFEAEGMESLFGSEHARRKKLPPAMRRLVVDLKAEYPAFNPNEIANACYVRFGRRPARKTVKRVLAEEPIPLRFVRRFPPYHEMGEPAERRRAVVVLHAEGWS